MKKRMLSLLMAILMVITLLPITAMAEGDTSSAEGSETTAVSPDYTWYGDGTAVTYALSDVDDLFGFADIVNGKAEGIAKDSFVGKTVCLKADIDLTGMVWTPIGTSMYGHMGTADGTKKFEGTFDGGNHTITGLTSDGYVVLEEDFASGEHSFGLFGYAYGANIKNVKLADVDIDCCGLPVENGSTADGSGVAALVGFYVPKHNAISVIENCHLLSGTVVASNNMGGLVGFLQVQGEGEAVDVTVKNCTNAATVVTKAREAGGILGLVQLNGSDYETTGTLKFENCTNTGDITAENGGGVSCAGGILGWENTYAYYGLVADVQIVFEDCTNTGDITAIGRNSEIHAAGIGSVQYHRGPWLVAKNCRNTGNITVENGASTSSFAGGIFAYALLVTLENSTSTQTVTALGNTTATLIGKISGGGCIISDDDILVTSHDGSNFVLNGGVAQRPTTYQSYYGRDTFRSSDPIRENFIFGGWYKTEGLTSQTPDYTQTAATEYPLGNTYHAKWIPVAPTVMVSSATDETVTLAAMHAVEDAVYAWYKDGELIPDETGSTLTVEFTAVRSEYTAVVSVDGIDSAVSDPAIVIFDAVAAALQAASEALTVESYNGVYDGEKHNITVTSGENAVAYYQDAEYSEETDGFENAGVYTVYYRVSVPVEDEIYYIGGTSTVTVSKAALTVRADNKTAIVGEDLPELTYTAVGFAGGDTFITEPVCTAADADMNTVGRYSITISGGDVSDNYEVEWIDGVLTVRNLDLPIEFTYSVTESKSEGSSGTVKFSSNYATPGSKVTVSVTPDQYYSVEAVIVRSSGGIAIEIIKNVDGTYSFVMPGDGVTVEVRYAWENPFTDVAEGTYYIHAVEWALKNGITEGTSETTFSPAAACTRAQMVTFLWRAAGSPEPTTTECAFEDVNMDSYYGKAVQWALENGITSGITATSFRPDMECSRAQMAAFLCRMADGKAESDESTFVDVADDTYYAESVRWAVENGITEGTGYNMFSPNATCTRGQMVTFLYRYYVK